MSERIENYALLGNCCTAALVALNGSIDWLCVPNFSSPACFAALLGTPEHGRWLIAPKEKLSSKRAYRGDTMILETVFTTATGSAMVIDFIPRTDLKDTRVVDLVRIIRPIQGTVICTIDITFRFDYGQVLPWVQKFDGGLRIVAGPDAVMLYSPVELHGKEYHSVGEVSVKEGGDDVAFVMTYFPSHYPAPEARDAKRLEAESEKFWNDWAGKYQSDNPWRAAILRSLLTLKAMTYEPTGGMVAAPTTSLPEEIGGERNWDYRYCWIRDASLTLFALLHGGYTQEAKQFRDWLLRAVAGDTRGLQIMYGIHGERRLTEFEMDWLPGYEASRPVRLGNGAHDQLQLDIYGEVCTALYLARRSATKLDASDVNGWWVQRVMMNFLEENWEKPDNGIWEMRGPRRQFTHSKITAWAAFDRTIRDAEKYGFDGPVERWKKTRDAIHADVCAKGFNKKKNTFTQYYGGENVDAALLLIPQIGFLPADDPRYVGTIEAVENELLMDDGLVMRYRNKEDVDGLQGTDATFLPCAFWLTAAYYQTGRKEHAVARFERLLKLQNDVGLLSEEYDPVAQRQLGNFPQAFSHVALIATAVMLTGEPSIGARE